MPVNEAVGDARHRAVPVAFLLLSG